MYWKQLCRDELLTAGMLFIFIVTDDYIQQSKIYIWRHCMKQLCGIIECEPMGLFMTQFSLPSSLWYKTHFSKQLNCWSLRCSWSIACRRCSNYIFILHLTLGLNLLRKDKMEAETRNIYVFGFGAPYIRYFTVFGEGEILHKLSSPTNVLQQGTPIVCPKQSRTALISVLNHVLFV